ncbi:uncharacterized protein FFMR_03121 [Fusarium fujikuroi]|nr:uncharacterized protein FFM5_01969 [Fusarium fujikuroi]SCO33503.1 uncharacterized protein FFMR_03121 [Fusarium fujikuroi]
MPWSRSLAVGRHSWPTNIWFDAAWFLPTYLAAKHQPLLVSIKPTSSLSELRKRPWMRSYSLGTLARREPKTDQFVKAGELRMCFPTPTTVRVLPWSNHIPPDHLGQEAIPGANNGSGDQTAH